MDILKNFGFDPLLFSAQIVNFLIILYLLQRFAFKPILKMLDDRKKTIIESEENARKTTETLEQAASQEDAIIAKAQETAHRLLTDAKKQASELRDELELSGRETASKLLADAREEIAQSKKKMEKEVAVSVARLAKEMVEKSLADLLTKEEQAKIAQRAISRLKK